MLTVRSVLTLGTTQREANQELSVQGSRICVAQDHRSRDESICQDTGRCQGLS